MNEVAGPRVAEPWLLYDGDCPFCSRYVKWVRLRENLPGLRLINARTGGAELEQVRSAGLDVDQGMVFAMDGRLYHGEECINVLALLSTPVGPFNRLNRLVFSSARLAALLYPALRAGRGAALALLGRSRIA
ncbi:MAG TPA: DCC1-like thiol-disulfide oxidoreductase family protein [Gammaproteobacteria bacterium]|jgi:predicted DCC family thiol-disulfide oxidoreductase YuxK